MSASPIDDDAIDFINQQLEAIAQSLPSVFSASLDVYLDQSSFSDGLEKANELITILSSMLATCGPDYEFLSTATSLDEISKGLENLEYYISSDIPNRQYDVLVALITELQSNILEGSIPNVPETEEAAMDVDEPASNDVVPIDVDTNGRIAVQLDKLCRLLKIDSSSANDSADVIALVQASIEELVRKHPKPEQILHPETILPATTVLTDAQKATQQHLEEALQQDFAIRRQMMLTRFEVTLESLLGEEDEEGAAMDDATARVRAAVKAQLKSIRRQPFLYRWEDALTAPVAIFYEQAKKVTGEAYTSAGSVVKKVVVGPVPDRGGRVNDLRQKKFYEGKSWGGGGGGGGRGNFQKGRGGGGGGGGGHDKGAKNDSKGNGGKNNSNNNNGKDGGNNNKQQNNNGGGSTANASGRVVTVTKEGEGSKGGADEHQRKKGRR